MPQKPRYNEKREYENRINEIRVARGLSYKKIADYCGCSKETIFLLSNGMVSPYHETKRNYGKIKPIVQKMLELFNLPIEDIFDREFCKMKDYESDIKTELTGEQMDGISHSTSIDFYALIKNRLYIDAISKRLTDKEKYVIKLFYYDGYSHKEIGLIMNVSQTNINSRLARAIQKMRHAIITMDNNEKRYQTKDFKEYVLAKNLETPGEASSKRWTDFLLACLKAAP